MFHQIGVDPKDRDVLRILWWEKRRLAGRSHKVSNGKARFQCNIIP